MTEPTSDPRPREPEWRPVVGRPGYEVSDDGQVRGPRGRILHTFPQKHGGHLRLELNGPPGKRKYLVHVLVARAFLGEPPPGHEVCHNDGDPTNNSLSNLRYGTKSENAMDRVRHGTNPWVNKTHGDCGHLLAAPNLVRGALKRRPHETGGRNCRACGCGRIAARRAGITDAAETRTVCDYYFARIMCTGRPHGAMDDYWNATLHRQAV